MMHQEPAVRFQNVSKRFKMASSRPQTILETLITFTRGQWLHRRQEQALWAVRDLTFDLMPGESLGLIGRNGSGKSTVLKLMARILRPTSGQIMVRGRVSALLELGAGFHPDLTGRENIYLNGSVLGLSREEVNGSFHSIVDFSELEEFIDVPVKHYSSGMYMRLGFSIAIHVQPTILIIDEILAVGDQAFQNKCVDAIYDMKRRGTTIILVSHNLDMMRNLCNRLLWLEQGQLRGNGPTQVVASQYLAATYKQKPHPSPSVNGGEGFRRWGTGDMEITAVRLLDEAEQETRAFQTHSHFIVEIDYVAHRPLHSPEIGLAIHRQDGVHVSGPNNRLGGLELGRVEGPGSVRYEVEQLPLLPARYFLTVAVHDGRLAVAHDYHDQAYPFWVDPGSNKELDGLIEIPASWQKIVEEKQPSA